MHGCLVARAAAGRREDNEEAKGTGGFRVCAGLITFPAVPGRRSLLSSDAKETVSHRLGFTYAP